MFGPSVTASENLQFLSHPNVATSGGFFLSGEAAFQSRLKRIGPLFVSPP